MTLADFLVRAERIIAERAALSARVRAALASSVARIARARADVEADAADAEQMGKQLGRARRALLRRPPC
jgi:hypothetical protein